MKTYLFYRKQEGGCDYTIGCGQTIDVFQASSMEEAVEKIVGPDIDWRKKALESKYGHDSYLSDYLHSRYLSNADDNPDNDCSCSKMFLYEVSAEQDILSILKQKIVEVKAFGKELDQKEQEREELAQYERLKKKLGK